MKRALDPTLCVPVAAIASGLLILAACSSDATSDPQGTAGTSAAGAAGSAGAGGAAGQAGSASLGGGAGADTGADASGGQAGSAGSAGNAGTAGAAGSSAEIPIEQLTDRAASASCDALFRCCNEKDLEAYFYLYSEDAILKKAGYDAKLPPKATLDLAGCKSLLKEMMDIVPFDDWVAQVKAGAVGYDGVAASQCVDALDKAACGGEVSAAIFDSTCFFISAPVGPAQRKLFSRTRSLPADACDPIKDGTGARFYGSCDPTKAFCCYEKSGNPGGCAFPFDADGNPRTGHCKAASTEGQSCNSGLSTVQLCVTGIDCNPDSNLCVGPVQKPLKVGDACIDAGFNELGQCTDSWCDSLGSSKCEPYKADGSDCMAAYECLSKGCNGGKCGAPTTCTTTSS
ncbi:MAG: hypothetical protein HY898_04945 [Deltaproteobacteria bacterium]|nr:hypothetical protein [Deltaproteobacteria bacterium]